MLVSIIIPIHNVAAFVEKCLQSVTAQTYDGPMECLLVDDCGIDDSIDICKRFISEYNGSILFRILHHDHNRGLSAARNTGIKAAKGKYIYFLDSDDWIIPECLEQMLECARMHPDSQIIFAGATATSGRYNWLDYGKKTLPEYSCDHDWLQRSMLRRFDFGMTAWNKLLLRSFILEHNLSFVEGLVHEDEVWNFDMSKHIRSASFVKQNTYIYNIHEKSIVTSASGNTRWERLFALWNVMLSKLDEDNKELQIRAISSCILEKTRWKFPTNHKKPLCKLFYKLSAQTNGILSLLLFVQGTLALCLPSKYPNHYTCSRIIL